MRQTEITEDFGETPPQFDDKNKGSRQSSNAPFYSAQNIVAQVTYDQFKPLFLFLSNQQWYKTQLKSSVPGSGPNNAFSAVVPNGVNGGQANVAVKEDRWKWITTANVGIWDTYRAWAPANQAIAPADVTNVGLDIPQPLPRLQDIAALINWRPPA